jgi:hypothetical protein
MTDQIRNELLDRGLTDILHLPEIVSVVGRHLSMSVGDDSVMSPTLEAIRDLLDSGYAIAGYVTKNDKGLLQIRSWDMSPSDSVKRIECDWSELGRPPNPGEVVWLELTDAGRAKIHSISDLGEGERELVQRVIARRHPELRERVSAIGQSKLNWKERQAFHSALADELAAVEQDDEAEGMEYAHRLRALVDRALVF